MISIATTPAIPRLSRPSRKPLSPHEEAKQSRRRALATAHKTTTAELIEQCQAWAGEISAGGLADWRADSLLVNLAVLAERSAVGVKLAAEGREALDGGSGDAEADCLAEFCTLFESEEDAS